MQLIDANSPNGAAIREPGASPRGGGAGLAAGLHRGLSDKTTRTAQPARSVIVLILGVTLCLPLLQTPALAHSFAPALLLLDEHTPGVFAVTWRRSDVSADATGSPLTPRLPAHCQPRATPEAPASPTAPSATLVDCRPAGLRGAVISVDGLEASQGDVILRIAWLDGQRASGVLHRTHNAFAVPGGGAADDGAAPWRVLHRYFVVGTQHILFGFDHLLFVLGLMLLVTNTPSLIKTISAFTLAHSVTLALATFGLVHLPPAPVEVLIALSLVLLAVEVARLETGYTVKTTLARQYPSGVAFLFGLLHGLGFARALAEIGVPANQITLSLLAFNLGVEAGQLSLVVVFAALAMAWARLGAPVRWARVAPAYAIGTLAVVWTLERVQQFWLPFGS